MAYKDFKKQQLERTKERDEPAFSDLIGETNNDGDIHDFIRNTEKNVELKSVDSFNALDSKTTKLLIELLMKYKSQVDAKVSWITKMGLLERKIMQYRFYRNTHVAFSTQALKSGDKIFTYILLRSPFVDLFKGKKEIRMYFNKMEDFPNISSVNELANDSKFYNSAIGEVRKEMKKIMSNDGIDFKTLFKEFDIIGEEIAVVKDEYQSRILLLEKTIQKLSIENQELKKKK